MRALGLVLLVAVTAGLAFFIGWSERDKRVPPPPTDAASSPALDSLDARTTRLRAALERLQPPSPEAENALRPPRTPRYREHLEWADSLGVPPVESERALSRHLASGALVPLMDTEHYVVRTLTHSKPFVTPGLQAALAETGRRFHAELQRAGLPRYRFTVSSALRTADLQADLGRRNRNAASGTSSHEYGVSADIVTFRFAPPLAPDSIAVAVTDPHLGRSNRLLAIATDEAARARWDHLFGALTRALGAMQREGRLLVLLEAAQPVFHVTHRLPPRD
jgi:hypothetical protein